MTGDQPALVAQALRAGSAGNAEQAEAEEAQAQAAMAAASDSVLVFGSGNRGLVYAGGESHRLTRDEIERRWPALLPGLTGHEGVSSAVVAPDAVVARSVLGPGVRVDAGAAVPGSVLMAGAHVGEGAVIERAILGKRAEVGPRARVDDVAVLGDDSSVGPGLRVSGGSLGVGEHLELSPARMQED